jgi:hypothetical protein
VVAPAKPKPMPIKPEEALEIVGLNPADFEDGDAFRDAVEKKFVSRDIAHKDKEVNARVLGKFNEVLKRKVGKVGKEAGIELPDDTDPIDLIDQLVPAFTGLKSQAEEWKTKAEKGIGEEVVNEWKGKLTKAEQESRAFQAQAKEWSEKYENLNTEIVTTKRKNVLDTEWSKAIGGVQFSSSVDDLRKEGFLAKVRSKYVVDLDDDLKPRLLSAETKEPIKHPRKAGELLTLEEAVKLEAKELKLVSENPHGDKPAGQQRKPVEQGQGAAAQGNRANGRPIREPRPAFGSWAKR